MRFLIVLTIAFVISLMVSCSQTATNQENKIYEPVAQEYFPERAKDMVIYEVNTRQYTPEGTFKAFMPHLERIKNMGVDILWMMPIQPIGLKNRKEDEKFQFY